MKKKITKFFGKTWPVVIALVLLSVPAALKLLGPGFYEPHDLHHFADIYQMFRAISSGQFPPRWGPDYLYNFGYPLFNFYYVFPFYLGAFFLWATGSIQLSFKLVFILCIFTSTISMYFLLREFVGKLAAFAGSVLFLYTPYRAVQIYVRGAMGEALSLALTPLIAFILIKIVKRPSSLKLIGIGGIIGAVFVLTHNYMWLFTFPWIILLALIFIGKNKIKSTIFSIIVSGGLMIGMSAYWWLPAIIEQKLVASATPFPLIDHFPFIKQLIIPSWGYGSSIPGPYDGLSFQIGLVNLAAVLAVIVALIFFKKLFKDRKLFWVAIWGVASFFIICFMMNIRSYPIWKIMPFHDFVQFPWRFLSFTTLFTAILAAVFIEVTKGKLRIVAGFSVIIISIILTYNYFRPSQIFYKTDNQYLSRFFADRTVQGTKNTIAKEYLQYSEDYLLLPKTDETKPSFLPAAKIESNTALVGNVKEVNAVSWTADVIATKNSTVSFDSLYFPGWFGSLDGKAVLLDIGKPYGQIEINVPKGSHKVAFYWQETNLRKIADIISLASLVICVTILVWTKRRANT